MINFTHLNWFKAGYAINSLMALGFFFTIIMYTLLGYYCLRRHKDKLRSKKMKSKFGAYYMHLKISQNSALMEPMVQQIRIICFIVAILFLPKNPFFQVMLSLYNWTALTIYIGWFHPYLDKRTWRSELFNEFFILLVIYTFLVLLDLVTDQWTLNFIGWMLIVIICANLILNLAIAMFDSIRATFLKMRLIFYTKKNKRLKAKLALKR